jgi:hypothetical protein
MANEEKLVEALRKLLQAVERCEDNDFSHESRINLSAAADAAAAVSDYYRQFGAWMKP